MQWSQIGSRAAKALSLLAGILVLLVALAALFGHMVASAHAAARSQACMSNEKQLCLAVSEYAEDNDGTYPSGNTHLKAPGAANWKGQGWALQVFPYVNSYSVYGCTCDVVDFDVDSEADDDNKHECYANANLYAVSYAYNGDLASYGASGLIPGKLTGNPMRQTEITSPSSQVLLSEVYDVCDTFTTTDTSYQSGAAEGSTVFALQNGHDVTTTTDNGRHQGGANYAMADGHAVWLRPDRVGTSAGVHHGTCPEAVCEGIYLGN